MKKYSLIVALVLVLSAGCVKRSLTVETDPPQATVTINGETVGKSPITVPFVYYGQYEILVEMKGYKSVKRIEKLRAPAYERFPADFVSEVAFPGNIKDRHTFTYKLEKLAITPESTRDLVKRADQTRKEYNQNKNKPTPTREKKVPAPAAEKKPPAKNFGPAHSAKAEPPKTTK